VAKQALAQLARPSQLALPAHAARHAQSVHGWQRLLDGVATDGMPATENLCNQRGSHLQAMAYAPLH
jgi:hypothetical protein